MVSQLVYPMIFQVYNVELFRFEDIDYEFIVIITYVFYVVLGCRDLNKVVEVYQIRKKMLKELTEIIVKGPYKQRNYYLKIYLHIKDKRLVKFGIIPTLVTVTLTILTLFPFIPQL